MRHNIRARFFRHSVYNTKTRFAVRYACIISTWLNKNEGRIGLFIPGRKLVDDIFFHTIYHHVMRSTLIITSQADDI